MTLLIACLLLYQIGASWWAYAFATVLWILHVFYHSES